MSALCKEFRQYEFKIVIQALLFYINEVCNFCNDGAVI